jgi:hypothetical protein
MKDVPLRDFFNTHSLFHSLASFHARLGRNRLPLFCKNFVSRFQNPTFRGTDPYCRAVHLAHDAFTLWCVSAFVVEIRPTGSSNPGNHVGAFLRHIGDREE